MNVSQLYIYPIKSLGGIAVSSVNITDRGFEHDRRWMLIDENNRFLSQREVTNMALLQVEILQHALRVYHKKDETNCIEISFTPTTAILNRPCRLVYMPDSTVVKIDPAYAVSDNDITSFSDGYPILMISEASLEDLNNKLDKPLLINRFRPNLVFTGGDAFIEESMKAFSINNCTFFGVKPCARCVMTTIEQESAEKGKEPLKTLSLYRRKDAKVIFGENVIAAGTGKISIGDMITVLQTKESII
jgi:uncharacterized protein